MFLFDLIFSIIRKILNDSSWKAFKNQSTWVWFCLCILNSDSRVPGHASRYVINSKERHSKKLKTVELILQINSGVFYRKDPLNSQYYSVSSSLVLPLLVGWSRYHEEWFNVQVWGQKCPWEGHETSFYHCEDH